jgi:hypothetical protein
MYDQGRIIGGLAVFVIVVTFPVWYNVITGKTSHRPELRIETKEKKCIEETPYMRASHMALLDLWRKRVVRQGLRIYQAANGKTYVMSLTGTCLSCHANKTQFCDQCHAYAGVTPSCWNCHTVPGEKS